MRPSGRAPHELRTIDFQTHFIKHVPASVLVSLGDTRVLCTASHQNGVPMFLKGKQRGWLTAEYSMLPRATLQRTQREAVRGKQSGRTQEIQRLIGRVLRTSLDLAALGEHTIVIDCDVLQADGGTRTAAINGSSVALAILLRQLQQDKPFSTHPLKHLTCAISVGIARGQPVLDLDYLEDSQADTDMNVVMNEHQQYIELQGTAEKHSFNQTELMALLSLAQQGCEHLTQRQRQVLQACQQ